MTLQETPDRARLGPAAGTSAVVGENTLADECPVPEITSPLEIWRNFFAKENLRVCNDI